MKKKITVNIEKSDDDIDYLSQLEKAKKLLDDDGITTDEYEILKQNIMSKVRSQ